MDAGTSVVDGALGEGAVEVARHPKWMINLLSLLILAGLAVAATLFGWLPHRVFVPTDTLNTAAPWADPAANYHPANEVLTDQTFQFVPWTIYAAQRLRHGEVPLWNPHQQLGAPFVANGQSAVFYPTMLLHMYLPPEWAWTLSAALRLWIAGVGMWLLAGRRDLSAAARLLAASAFMICGFCVVWLNHPHMNVLALLPWAILGLEWLIDRPSTLRVATVAIVFALQFLGGHPASCIHLLLICGVLYGTQLWLRPKPALKALAPALAALAVGFLLAGVQWVPLLDYVRSSATAEYRSVSMAREKFRPDYLLGVLFPYANGYPDGVAPYQMSYATRLPNSNELSGGYAGVLALLLAGMAVLWGRRRQVAPWLVLIAVCALIGIHSPGVEYLVRRVPGLKVAQNARLLIGVALGVAMLAGIGLDGLLAWLKRASEPAAPETAATDLSPPQLPADGAAEETSAPPQTNSSAMADPAPLRLSRWLAYISAGLAVLAIVGFVGLLIAKGPIIRRGQAKVEQQDAAAEGAREHTDEWRQQLVVRIHKEAMFTSLRLLIPAAVLAGAAGLLWLRVRRPELLIGHRGWPWVALACVELLAFGTFYNRGARSDTYYRHTAATDWLQERRQDAPVLYRPRVAGTFSNLYPEAATAYGLDDVRAYDALSSRRVAACFAATGEMDANDPLKRLVNPESPVWNLMGLKYLVSGPMQAGPGGAWKPAATFPEAVVYENPKAMPRFWMAPRLEKLASVDEVLERMGTPGFDPRKVVLSDGGLTRTNWELVSRPAMWWQMFKAGGDWWTIQASGDAQPKARVLADTPEKVELLVENSRGGWLVMADSYAEGWIAGVNQRPERPEMQRQVPIVPAYGALRAIPVPPADGEVKVTFQYMPQAWKHGLFATGGGIVALLLLAAWSLLAAHKTAKSSKEGSGCQS